MSASPEELEWQKMTAGRASQSRKAMARLVVSVAIAAACMVGAFVAMGRTAEAVKAEQDARLERGETVVEIRSRVDIPVLPLIAALGVCGLVGFLVPFYALGGRLSAEHARGLRGFFR